MAQKKRPVDVISICNVEGEILPLRIQFLDDTGQLLRLHIRQARQVREITHVGVEAAVFQCSAWVHDRDLRFQLQYSFRNHTWHLL